MMSDDDPQCPPRLAEDLASLYRPPAPVSVPAKLDDAILNRARAGMARSRRRRTMRWAGAAAVAAAACVAIVVRVTLLDRGQSQRSTPVAMQLAQPRVTILDALKLARQIQTGEGHDVNGDGR